MIKRNIVLVGMMGSGKSHIGRKLASQMGWQFVDTDRRIERAEKMTIAEFYHTAGEKAFRERETNVLYQVSRYHEAVISYGGNFPMSVASYRILHRNGYIIALHSDTKRVEERVARHVGKRPTVDYENLHEFVLSMRKDWEKVYRYCDFVADTTSGGAGQIVEMILARIKADGIEFEVREEKRSLE